jgi:hypothetical protein
VGPPKPVRCPQGGDSGEWVTQLERSPAPADGPPGLALRVFMNNLG